MNPKLCTGFAPVQLSTTVSSPGRPSLRLVPMLSDRSAPAWNAPQSALGDPLKAPHPLVSPNRLPFRFGGAAVAGVPARTRIAACDVEARPSALVAVTVSVHTPAVTGGSQLPPMASELRNVV